MFVEVVVDLLVAITETSIWLDAVNRVVSVVAAGFDIANLLSPISLLYSQPPGIG